jgi:hypothetical protein
MALFAVACGSPTEPAIPLTRGWWTSGNGWGLRVDTAAVSVFSGCGHGEFPTPQLGRAGSFDVDGTFAISVGPPPLPGNVDPPARFLGTVSGTQLTIRIEQRNGTSYGPIVFRFDGDEPKRPISPPCP